jgi:hypothetical protein
MVGETTRVVKSNSSIDGKEMSEVKNERIDGRESWEMKSWS